MDECVEVFYAREREEQNMDWNMKIIDAVSTVDGTDVMNAVRVVVAWCDI
mgnify:FL=1